MTDQPESSGQMEAEIHQIRMRLASLEAAVQRLQGQRQSLAAPPPLPQQRAAQPSRPTASPSMPVAQASVTPAQPMEPKPHAPSPVPDWVSFPPIDKPVPIAAQAVATAMPAESKRTFNFEQLIGLRGMLIAGVILMILGGVFFFMLALDRGWIDAKMRLVIGGVFGLALIGGGEFCIRKNMRMFAAGIIGVGIVWLYQVVFLASPKGLYEGLRFMGPEVSFGLMCTVTLLGIGLSVQTKQLTTAVISLVGAIATPILLSTGKNAQVILMCYLLVVDAGFLALAYFRRWQVLAPLTLAGTAILFGGWYAQYYDATQFALTVAFAWALAGLHAAWCLLCDKTKRAHPMMAEAILLAAAAGVEVLAWLTCDGSDYTHAFAIQLLVVAAGVMAYAICRRQPPLLAVCYTLAMALQWEWSLSHDGAQRIGTTCVYGWIYLAGPIAALLLRRLENLKVIQNAMLAIFAAGSVIGWLSLEEHLSPWGFCWQLLALDVFVLFICQWQRWHWLRAGLLAWTAVALVGQYCQLPHGGVLGDLSADSMPWLRWFTTGWTWTFFGLLMADILIRAWRRSVQTIEMLDACLACAATGLMFASTYALLYQTYHGWMGLYTAGLAAGIIMVVWAVHSLAGRKVLANAFLAQALVLLALAASIQFQRYEVVLAWSVLAVPAMLLARWLGNRLLWLYSPVVLVLAMVRLQYDSTIDSAGTIAVFWWNLAALDCHNLSLAIWTVAALLSAGILRFAKPIVSEAEDLILAKWTVGLTATFMAFRTAADLSVTQASWVWLALAVVLAAVALWQKSRWLSVGAMLMLVATACKWLAYDTLGRRLAGLPEPAAFLINGQFIIGLVMCAGLLTYFKLLKARGLQLPRTWTTAIGLLAAVLVLWAGSFEIDRYYCTGGKLPSGDVAQAMQITYSLWWAIYAVAVLTIGFILSQSPTRYLAIAVFTVTLGKVFIVDLSHVDIAYRVLSFMGLGILLLVGSLLYHRRFRQKA